MSTTIGRDTDLAAALRDVMGDVCTPVAVVTSCTDGKPFGSTVSAFTSLSMNPPMVLVALSRESETLRVVMSSGKFGVNVLGSENKDLAATFARKAVDKFQGVQWRLSSGTPRIIDAAAWIACDVSTLTDGGDHVIISGHVVDAQLNTAAPLTYYRRQFGTHLPFPADI